MDHDIYSNFTSNPYIDFRLVNLLNYELEIFGYALKTRYEAK